MAIIDALLSSLVDDAPVKDIKVGLFWTGVLSSQCGLASTTRDDYFVHGDKPVGGAGRLTEKSARDLAYLALSNSPVEATIGVAALNSLIPVEESACVEANAGDLLLSWGKGKRIALIGRFPCIPNIRDVAKELWVLERNPAPEDLAADEAPKIIPKADIVAITGSALINGTLEDLLSLCEPSSKVMVLGPSTPLSPILFDFGVDVVSGTRVIDEDLALRAVEQGATFRQIPGCKLLTIARDRQLIS